MPTTTSRSRLRLRHRLVCISYKYIYIYRNVLYVIVLYYIILYYVMLYYIILYYIILYILLYYIFYYIILYYIILYMYVRTYVQYAYLVSCINMHAQVWKVNSSCVYYVFHSPTWGLSSTVKNLKIGGLAWLKSWKRLALFDIPPSNLGRILIHKPSLRDSKIDFWVWEATITLSLCNTMFVGCSMPSLVMDGKYWKNPSKLREMFCKHRTVGTVGVRSNCSVQKSGPHWLVGLVVCFVSSLLFKLGTLEVCFWHSWCYIIPFKKGSLEKQYVQYLTHFE